MRLTAEVPPFPDGMAGAAGNWFAVHASKGWKRTRLRRATPCPRRPRSPRRSRRARTLPGVGKTYCRERPERMVRHPSTGERMKKDSGRVVKITVSKALKDSINA